MLLLPVHTPLLKPGDDLASAIIKGGALQSGDIVVVSSKAVATVENAFIELASMSISHEAQECSTRCGRSAGFCQAVLGELKRLNGEIIGNCPGALLTEVQPEGPMKGTILTANAGLDESNAPTGMAIGWPRDPVLSIRKLKEVLESLLVNGWLVNSYGKDGFSSRAHPVLCQYTRR